MRPFLSLALALPLAVSSLAAQTTKRDLLTGPIDDTNVVTISGNVRPEVAHAEDQGRIAADSPLGGIVLLHRSPEVQAAFEAYLAQLSKPNAKLYHHWLTNAQIGEMFGPSNHDVSRVNLWLLSQGLTPEAASPDGMTIAFTGIAEHVEQAFHTEIHTLEYEGKQHYANVTDPQLPSALLPVVAGVVSLNDFHPTRQPLPARSRAQPEGTLGNGTNFISPSDLATFYNFNPVFDKGITGKGVTIAVLEPYDQSSLGDWQVFRKVFGLSRKYPYGTLTEQHPQGSAPCVDPGPSSANNNGNEQAIDVDWSTAAAPNATIISAACANTVGTFGGFLALQNLLQQSIHPSVVSISFGAPEVELGATYQAYISSLYSMASMEGISVYVSGGDQGPASKASFPQKYGLAVNGYSSTAYNTSVGGTDSGITALHATGKYFNTTDLPNYQTVLSYIPEIPWDDTCASSLVASYYGYPTVGPSSLCNSTNSGVFVRNNVAGGGGPSRCSSGAPQTPGVVSGTCEGTPKPVWQSVLGVPNDGLRDIPDVSLYASGGYWGLTYVVCNSYAQPCTQGPSTWTEVGGTSVAAPIWAGIQALVNEATKSDWGLANPQIYSLANNAYGANGNPGCSASLGSESSSNCIFHDITAGDNAIPCIGTVDCYIDGGKYGVMSTSDTTLQAAFPATTGYDLATGIGTVNVTNFVNAWMLSFPAPPVK